jgi:hypothetical protein
MTRRHGIVPELDPLPSWEVFPPGDVTDFDRPLRDGELADLLERLASWNPRVIGVDIYCDKSKPPGTERLADSRPAQEIVWVSPIRNIRLLGS